MRGRIECPSCGWMLLEMIVMLGIFVAVFVLTISGQGLFPL